MMTWFSNIPTHMDYEGQGRAELWSQLIILTCTVFGAIWAYVSQQYSLAFFSHVFGFVTACVLCLPPWPIYRRKPLKWQRPVNPSITEQRRQGSKLSKEPKSFMGKICEWCYVYETRLSINLLQPWEKFVLYIFVFSFISGSSYIIWLYAVPRVGSLLYDNIKWIPPW